LSVAALYVALVQRTWAWFWSVNASAGPHIASGGEALVWWSASATRLSVSLTNTAVIGPRADQKQRGFDLQVGLGGVPLIIEVIKGVGISWSIESQDASARNIRINDTVFIGAGRSWAGNGITGTSTIGPFEVQSSSLSRVKSSQIHGQSVVDKHPHVVISVEGEDFISLISEPQVGREGVCKVVPYSGSQLEHVSKPLTIDREPLVIR